MVQQQHVLARLQPHQRGAQQRSCARSKGRWPSSGASRLDLGLALRGGQRAHVHAREREVARRMQVLHGPARPPHGSVVRRTLVARTSSPSVASRAARVQVARPGAGPRACCRARCPAQLVEEPEPLLRERERQRARCAGTSGRKRGARAPRPGLARLQPLGERWPRCGASKSARSGQLHAAAPRAGETHLRGQQRVAAQLEEVVVHADAVDARSTSRPDGGQRSSVAVRGAT